MGCSFAFQVIKLTSPNQYDSAVCRLDCAQVYVAADCKCFMAMDRRFLKQEYAHLNVCSAANATCVNRIINEARAVECVT